MGNCSSGLTAVVFESQSFLTAAVGTMKKFFNKTVMDYKFRKAGEGHRLDEEKKPRPQPPVVAVGRPASSQSSATAGQAAIARLEGGGGGGGGRVRSLEGPRARHSPKTTPQNARDPQSPSSGVR